jgi:hypothetical protein
VVFRADAAFAKPMLYEALEERDVKYAIRLPANDILQRDIRDLLTRPSNSCVKLFPQTTRTSLSFMTATRSSPPDSILR